MRNQITLLACLCDPHRGLTVRSILSVFFETAFNPIVNSTILLLCGLGKSEVKFMLWQRFRDYIRNTGGSYSLFAGFLMFPLAIATGMSVDMGRRVKADAALQDALDTAALYAANVEYDDQLDLETQAKVIFTENLKDRVDFTVTKFKAVPQKDGRISLLAEGVVDPVFMHLGGITDMPIFAESDVIAQSDTGIELVIAFDTTASMGFGTTWEDATETLGRVLTRIERWTGHEGFYVTLVPFSDRVRVGTGRESWLDSAAPNNWNGCVEPREEDQNGFQWASDADIPGTDPFQASIPNVTGGLAGVFRRGKLRGPFCPNVPLTGPTSDVDTIITAANKLKTNGGTGRFDDAMAWTWRLLSPNWAGLWNPADTGYPALNVEDRRKVVIYVTDGRTEAYTHELSKERSWNWNQGSIVGFEHMVHVCDQMKAEDIEIYMFRVNGNHNAASYMQSCSTDPTTHYKVVHNNSQLELAFLDVMRSVKTDLHLAK